MLVDGVCGHFGDVLRRLGLNVQSDQGVGHQVMDRLKPLLSDKVLPIVEQSVVEGLMPEPVRDGGKFNLVRIKGNSVTILPSLDC